ncbi:uncharacterized protein KY384_002634 [Bacidia gigantensis]|uniref:uncharacterized protein n=1 Tax=Bacidia gigantensis TaxID=2732470 RepID=UPI001D05B1A2|nr:uncharacterized protein KY384_002634 [Bacidia gigantensis]KAG8532756.1 hypothetical protein KY384_002634 [Bacidia gigantensis]
MSPLQSSFAAIDLEKKPNPPIQSDETPKPPVTTTFPITASEDIPINIEGDSNPVHPLLQEERHARFAARAGLASPGSRSSQDLPLRHYYSQVDLASSKPGLSERNKDTLKTPKRSSSLVYTPTHFTIMPTGTQSPEPGTIHPTSDQPTLNASAINLMPRNNNVPPEAELGIHPAHRLNDPNFATTMAPSPGPSTISSTTEQGATPQPISTGPLHANSPPARFSPSPIPRVQSPSSARSRPPDGPPPPPPVQSADSSGQPKVSHPTQMPFYLNPASSSALIDFLQSTPPPSPPHSAARADTGPPANTSTSNFFTQHFSNRGNTSSPPPPGPSGPRMGPWSASTNDLASGRMNGSMGTQRKGLGWKKMFSGHAKSTKEPKERSSKKRINWGKDTTAEGLNNLGLTNGKTEDSREKDRDGGFMGVGKDGVWISRRNFVRN